LPSIRRKQGYELWIGSVQFEGLYTNVQPKKVKKVWFISFEPVDDRPKFMPRTSRIRGRWVTVGVILLSLLIFIQRFLK
jgi:hypothetical protein